MVVKKASILADFRGRISGKNTQIILLQRTGTTITYKGTTTPQTSLLSSPPLLKTVFSKRTIIPEPD